MVEDIKGTHVVCKVFFPPFVPQFFLLNMLMFYVIVAGCSLHQL